MCAVMLEHSDEDGSVYTDSGDWNEDYNSFDEDSDELSDGDVPLDALLEWLEDSDTDVRVRALDKLGGVGSGDNRAARQRRGREA